MRQLKQYAAADFLEQWVLGTLELEPLLDISAILSLLFKILGNPCGCMEAIFNRTFIGIKGAVSLSQNTFSFKAGLPVLPPIVDDFNKGRIKFHPQVHLPTCCWVSSCWRRRPTEP